MIPDSQSTEEALQPLEKVLAPSLASLSPSDSERLEEEAAFSIIAYALLTSR